MELIIVAVVVGVAILAAWPLARVRRRQGSPPDQGPVTDTGVVPPRNPREPVPGSRADRRRHGKP
jgi:hypothetical protein